MVEKILQLLSVTCGHRHTSQAFSSDVKKSDPRADWDAVGPAMAHYVVCLDCGRKFNYDWDQMRIVRG
jgi:hypothetical protein